MPNGLTCRRVVVRQYLGVWNHKINGLGRRETSLWRQDHGFNKGAFLRSGAHTLPLVAADLVFTFIYVGDDLFWNKNPAQSALQEVDLDGINNIGLIPAEVAAEIIGPIIPNPISISIILRSQHPVGQRDILSTRIWLGGRTGQ